jgi:AcrR family transcriptional regulator
MSPRAADPTVADRLVEAAATVLSTEGRDAVSARRLAREVGTSTMAVYTHFGGMDEVIGAVRREGFRRFGATVSRPALTDDPVADWCAQGWAYRHFAVTETHLWSVIFGPIGQDFDDASDADAAAALETFTALETRVARCAELGRWELDDATTVAEVCWSHMHGLVSVELSGYFTGMGRDPVPVLEESMRRTSLGFGDEPALTERSVRTARRRARTAGQHAR